MKKYTDFVSLFENYYAQQKFNERYDIYRAMNYIMAMPSKRVRPALTLMACELFGGKAKTALQAAAAVELYHNSTLVHDDIMDKAEQRRGNPTVHKVYGNNVAINTGDVMFMQSYRFLLQTKRGNVHELTSLFNDAVLKVIEGQSLDMEFETTSEISEADYLKMIEGKTAVLLAAALQMGAWVADADKKSQKSIYKFGVNLGLSFQIQDDYLDAFGDGKKTGKAVGGDIVLNKKTLLLVKALELGSNKQKQKIKVLLSEKNKSKKVTEMQQLITETGAKQYAEKLIDSYYQKALNHLGKIEVKNEKKQALADLAEMLRFREK